MQEIKQKINEVRESRLRFKSDLKKKLIKWDGFPNLTKKQLVVKMSEEYKDDSFQTSDTIIDTMKEFEKYIKSKPVRYVQKLQSQASEEKATEMNSPGRTKKEKMAPEQRDDFFRLRTQLTEVKEELRNEKSKNKKLKKKISMMQKKEKAIIIESARSKARYRDLVNFAKAVYRETCILRSSRRAKKVDWKKKAEKYLNDMTEKSPSERTRSKLRGGGLGYTETTKRTYRQWVMPYAEYLNEHKVSPS